MTGNPNYGGGQLECGISALRPIFRARWPALAGTLVCDAVRAVKQMAGGPGRRATLAMIASWAVAGHVLSVPSPVFALQFEARSPAFENPPLRYEGPDPTSQYFLPSSSPWSPAPATLSTTAPSAAELLPPQSGEFATEGTEPLIPDPWQAGIESLGYGDEPLVCGITDHKDGFFQKLGVTWTWIDRRKEDEYGLHEFDSFVMVAVPAPSREWPLLISPTFNARLIDGPAAPDLPSRIYEAYIDFVWLPQLSPRWTGIVGVAPSYYGDFEVDASEAFRLTGKGLARFDWMPDRLQFLFGVLYLNRNDVKLLPAGGLIWTPSDARRYELLFPRPKLAHRIALGPDFEDWIYLAGEFGGNTYAIERVGGANDFITLRDIRVSIGLERKKDGGAGYRLEAGYVFGRRVEYDSATPDIEADDTAMLRGGFTF